MKTLSTIVIFLFLAGFTPDQEDDPIPLNIVPQPVSIKTGKEAKYWMDRITLVANTPEEKQAASVLSALLRAKQFRPSVKGKSNDGNMVMLKIINDDSIGKEGYKLSVNSAGASIEAGTGAGLFYGVQTLVQIMDIKKKTPLTEITDYPRFGYRGLHLDVGRHMFPPEFIKKYIDLLARHKYNRFHWHLTEDQGWRIEIKKYPKLKEIAAYRKETVIGKQTTRTRAQAKYDGVAYGGFYTQEEVKDIVNYAAERHVTIIPEIELPGHAQAALAAYPNLGCTSGPYEVATSWGVFKDVYCAGKEDTFTFLQDVLDEVLVLFPGQYIHIGGDECPKDRWKACPHCQKRMSDENLKDEHGLQSYFVQRIEKYLNSKGRQIIGWDEILEGGLAANATVMSWRGEQGGIAAARQNHDVIMTPENWCYLDHAQDTSKSEPLSIGNFTPVSEVYSYEPVPDQLSAEEAKHILGAQCNVWTEYIKTPQHAEYMVYPRAVAMAEVLWSPKESRNYTNFIHRMKTHTQRLKEWNVNYAKHIEREF
jgi:hexosaminidase